MDVGELWPQAQLRARAGLVGSIDGISGELLLGVEGACFACTAEYALIDFGSSGQTLRPSSLVLIRSDFSSPRPQAPAIPGQFRSDQAPPPGDSRLRGRRSQGCLDLRPDPVALSVAAVAVLGHLLQKPTRPFRFRANIQHLDRRNINKSKQCEQLTIARCTFSIATFHYRSISLGWLPPFQPTEPTGIQAPPPIHLLLQ